MRRPTIAIVLLVMLAIPFQGFAAAVMQSGCALGHHRTNPGAESHHHIEQHDHAAMLATVTQADAGDSETAAALDCKCGACGLGTALPVSKLESALAASHAAPLGCFADLPVVMITGGPERPPRHLLA